MCVFNPEAHFTDDMDQHLQERFADDMVSFQLFLEGERQNLTHLLPELSMCHPLTTNNNKQQNLCILHTSSWPCFESQVCSRA